MDRYDLHPKLREKLEKTFNLDEPMEMHTALTISRELDDFFGGFKDELCMDFVDGMIRAVETARGGMSDPGKLGLPPLLEQRRWEYLITDGAFGFQPFYDRVLVHQTLQDAHFFKRAGGKGSGLYLPEVGEKRERESNPEGILVSAGLKALDELRNNGIDLGDKVTFLRMAPFRYRVDVVDGHEFYLMVLRCGDIIGSADLAKRIRSGELRVDYDQENFQHYFIDREQREWRPAQTEPYIPDDY